MMHAELKKRNIALLVLGTGVLMFVIMLVFVLPYFMSEKKYGEMQSALNEADYYKVFKIAEFLLDQDPSSLQAYYFRGQAYLALQKYEQAERDLEKVIALNVQYSNMRNVGIQLGEIYHKHGVAVVNKEPDKAYRLFKKATKFLPRDNNLKHDLALASYYVGQAVENKDKNKAIKFYGEAVKYQPDKSIYKIALGRCLYDIAKTEEAVALLDEALNKEPQLKTPINIELLKSALWNLALSKERDFYEGKITDVTLATKRLDQILGLNILSKDIFLERFALAINTNNIKDAQTVMDSINKRGLGIVIPVEDIGLLLNQPWNVQPKTIFNGGNETDVEVKLDSELAWSADGTKIIVKAMDKSTSQTKILVYQFSDASVKVIQSQDKIAWEGKIFTPSNDGVIITSENFIYKMTEDLGLEKLAELDDSVFDVARDGKSALVGKGKKLSSFDFNTKRKRAYSLNRLSGNIFAATYSPLNKRIAVAVEENDNKELGVLLSRNRTRSLVEGNISSLKWSWDGEKIYYLNTQSGINSLFAATVDTNAEPEALIKPEFNTNVFEPSPIDNYVLFKGSAGKEMLLLLDSQKKIVAATPRYGQFGKLVWSPDGSKAAYLFSPVQGGPVRLETIDIKK